MGIRMQGRSKVTFCRSASPEAALCCCLSAGEKASGSIGHFQSDRMNWQEVFVCAGHHFVTPALATALSRIGAYERLTQEERDYLDAIKLLHKSRNRILRHELSRIATALNDVKIQPILLKGAISLVQNQYCGAEDRVIGDFDLLVPIDRLAAAQAAIRALGYKEKEDGSVRWALKRDKDLSHHAPALLHPSLPVAVELHHRLLSDKDDSDLLSAALVTETKTLDCGAVVLLPDPATRLLHNMLHAQISHEQFDTKELDIRQLVEFAAISEFHRDHIHIGALLNRLRPHRTVLLAEYWAKAERWLGLEYPQSLPRSPRERRELWFVEIISTNAPLRRLFRKARAFIRTPRRVLNFILRVLEMPDYLPYRLKKILAR